MSQSGHSLFIVTVPVSEEEDEQNEYGQSTLSSFEEKKNPTAESKVSAETDEKEVSVHTAANDADENSSLLASDDIAAEKSQLPASLSDISTEENDTLTDNQPEISQILANSSNDGTEKLKSAKIGASDSAEQNSTASSSRVLENEGSTKRKSLQETQIVEEMVDFLMSEHSTKEFLDAILHYYKINNDVWTTSVDKLTYMVTFAVESGRFEEEVLDSLLAYNIGNSPNTSVRVVSLTVNVQSGVVESAALPQEVDTPGRVRFSPSTAGLDAGGDVEANDNPVSLPMETTSDEKSHFMKSIKSRIIVKSVIYGIKSNALFTFDYLMFTIIASIIAAVGLLESNSVILVASMLISPIMGPILAGTFGFVIGDNELRNIGLRSELIGLGICILTGFIVGLPTTVIGPSWGSTSTWPTFEMSSRGLPRGLGVGVLIAAPSGAGVALSVLSGNHGSLVGVAISASLLPPAVNTGMLWASSIVSIISPPKLHVPAADLTYNLTQDVNSPFADENGTCYALVGNDYVPHYACFMARETAILGVISLMLTIINIICIVATATILLRIKEVSSRVSTKEKVQFWSYHLPVSKAYSKTLKDKHAADAREKLLALTRKSDDGMCDVEKLISITRELEDDDTYRTVLGAIGGYSTPYKPRLTDFGLHDSTRVHNTIQAGDIGLRKRRPSETSVDNQRRLQLMRQISAHEYMQKSEYKKMFEKKGRFEIKKAD